MEINIFNHLELIVFKLNKSNNISEAKKKQKYLHKLLKLRDLLVKEINLEEDEATALITLITDQTIQTASVNGYKLKREGFKYLLTVNGIEYTIKPHNKTYKIL